MTDVNEANKRKTRISLPINVRIQKKQKDFKTLDINEADKRKTLPTDVRTEKKQKDFRRNEEKSNRSVQLNKVHKV